MALIGNIAIGASVNTKGLAKDLATADKALSQFGASAASLGASLTKSFAALSVGAAAFDALKSSIGTAVDLEKAITGLSKASDLEGAGLESMKGQLFGLSTELKGVPLDDILAIATNLSKMGTANDSLVEQTRGIAMLSTAIDDIPVELMTDQIGKLNSVFKLGDKGALQMGSALDKIADSGLSSASGILDVTARIGGTANAMKLGAGETMSMAAALLDTGTSAEQAGSAINNMLMNMVAVENRKDFAKTAGMSVQEFGDLVANKPMKAVESFLVGLGKLDAAGQLAALSSAGITAQERQAAMQKLAQQTGKLGEYVGMAAKQFQTLDQIQQSYNKTAQQTDAAWVTFNNRISIVSNTLGSVFLPAINSALGTLGADIDAANKSAKSLIDTVGSIPSGKSSKGMGVGEILSKAAPWMGPAGVIPGAIGHFMGGDVPGKKAAPDAVKGAIPNAPPGGKKPPPMLPPGGDLASEVESVAAKVAKEIGSLEKELQLQIATFGKSSTEVDLYKLSLDGATAAQIQTARTLTTQLEAMERQKKVIDDQVEAQKRLKEEGKSLYEETRTPLEKYAAEVQRLQGLLSAGAITGDTFDRAKLAAGDLLNEDKGKGKDDGPTHAAALQAGSAEAYSAQLKFGAQGGGSRDEPIKDVAKETTKQTELLRQLLQETKQQKRPNAGPVELFNL
ncbi:phage tail tape measure protein, TP901 family, core region [Singulisphaera sp. GP187]|uniref:phage tail tape measure protein n=1 Tax=Singulisphaera sp. GP187 TaxID=1882752 RepID=UPI0009283D77|nr:phage tail tape measure protein [Singulisphaera sp. GP187]SIN97666.1 phage tail tape measure protein, TP901 family, core region [Singulisphaera sp. GP187]